MFVVLNKSVYCQEPDGVRIPEVLVPYMAGMTFIPFVRDSKPVDKSSAPSASASAAIKEKSSTNTTPKPAPAPAPAPAPVSTVKAAPAPSPAAAALVAAVAVAVSSGSPEVDQLAAQVTAKGDEIRALKAAKVPCVQIMCMVSFH